MRGLVSWMLSVKKSKCWGAANHLAGIFRQGRSPDRLTFKSWRRGFPTKLVNLGNALKQPADSQLGIEELKLKDSAGRQQQYLPRSRNLLPIKHHWASHSATGLKQHSGATGACFAEAGLMPNWRHANCITNWLKTDGSICLPAPTLNS